MLGQGKFEIAGPLSLHLTKNAGAADLGTFLQFQSYLTWRRNQVRTCFLRRDTKVSKGALMLGPLEKIKEKNFTLAVVGVGRVGLPLSVAFASKGVKVIGIDINPEHVAQLEKGKVPFFEPKLEELLLKSLKEGLFHVTTDFNTIDEADAIIVTVDTPLTHDLRPDCTHLYRALDDVSKHRLNGKLLIIRSTVPPGTTEIVANYLENKTGLKIGKSFYLAYCPERIMEGKAIEELYSLPEIVGAIERASSDLAAEVFRILNPEKKILATTFKEAELAKLFTNIYRYINFALSNQFALVAEHYGADAYEAIRVANENYGRAMIPVPGPAGGPCLYKDGYMLSYTSFIDLIKSAWHINESIPSHLVNRIKNEIKGTAGKKVALLGLSYKADLDDTRHSPAVKLFDILKTEGFEVTAHDPHIRSDPLEAALRGADVVILAVNHSKFKELSPRVLAELIKPGALLVDCWGFFDKAKVKEAGLKYLGLGRGTA